MNRTPLDAKVWPLILRKACRLKHWLLVSCTVLSVVSLPAMADQSEWPMFGQNIANTSSAPQEQAFSKSNVSSLKPRWTATLGGDISARVAVVNGVAYVPDWAGNIWAINTSNGKAIWSHQLSDYGLAAGTSSRTSPAVVGGVVYIGTQGNQAANAGKGDGGWLLAIDAS